MNSRNEESIVAAGVLAPNENNWLINPGIPTTRGLSCEKWSRSAVIRVCSGNDAATAGNN
jgi:hypothetical protein